MESSDVSTELAPAQVEPPVLDLVPLTTEEETFCVALVESGGNPKAAYAMLYPDDPRPGVRGRVLMQRPQVVARLKQLMTSVEESALITIGSHLVELANIRDTALMQGNVKVALQAERNRGEVVGLYKQTDLNVNGPSNIQINFVSKYDERI